MIPSQVYQNLISSYTEHTPHRHIAFFDAVYAIVMAILVLGLTIPEHSAILSPGQIFEEMLPQCMYFALTFFILGALWAEYHRLFARVKKTDRMLIRITIITLFITCLLPFTSSLSGDNHTRGSFVILFHINMLLLGLMFLFQWIYISKSGLSVPVPKKLHNFIFFKSCIVPLVSGMAIIAVFFSPIWSLACYLLIPVLEGLLTRLKSHQSGSSDTIKAEKSDVDLLISINITNQIKLALEKVSDEMEISNEDLITKILHRWSNENTVNTGQHAQLCRISENR